MPPRINLRPSTRSLRPCKTTGWRAPVSCRYAHAAAAITPAASNEQTTRSISPVMHYPKTQPPSHKPPEFRKSQLLRQYVSLLRSTPLMLLLQHNNLVSTEWVALRRELATALRKVDEKLGHGNDRVHEADEIKLHTIQTGIFAPALRIAEFYNPEETTVARQPTDPSINSSAQIPNIKPSPDDPSLAHSLSRTAYQAVLKKKGKHPLAPLLAGPVVLLTFPTVSPPHLAAALSILSPNKAFPAPTRRARPAYHEADVQAAVHKLVLLGARVEGKVFDGEGVRWVGEIEGGLDGLRASLVAMLQGMGGSITNALESAGRSLYFTMEDRKGMLEDEEKGGKKEE
ncbi:MAG: hypothetical protein M1834_001738 [Cirrosporium novae-zelandiae]|nr:MAG: hypothetical protein M1834_001738 [Cirrosporium novae-zelandiae]